MLFEHENEPLDWRIWPWQWLGSLEVVLYRELWKIPIFNVNEILTSIMIIRVVRLLSHQWLEPYCLWTFLLALYFFQIPTSITARHWQLGNADDFEEDENDAFPLFQSTQDGIYPSRYGDDVDHQRYHDHQDAYGAFQHDRVQRWHVHVSYESLNNELANQSSARRNDECTVNLHFKKRILTIFTTGKEAKQRIWNGWLPLWLILR